VGQKVAIFSQQAAANFQPRLWVLKNPIWPHNFSKTGVFSPNFRTFGQKFSYKTKTAQNVEGGGAIAPSCPPAMQKIKTVKRVSSLNAVTRVGRLITRGDGSFSA